MKVSIRFFSSCRDATGVSGTVVNVPNGTALGELIRLLLFGYPKLKKLESTAVYAVNKELASVDTILEDGDEMAMMPPVGGG